MTQFREMRLLGGASDKTGDAQLSRETYTSMMYISKRTFHHRQLSVLLGGVSVETHANHSKLVYFRIYILP